MAPAAETVRRMSGLSRRTSTDLPTVRRVAAQYGIVVHWPNTLAPHTRRILLGQSTFRIDPLWRPP